MDEEYYNLLKVKATDIVKYIANKKFYTDFSYNVDKHFNIVYYVKSNTLNLYYAGELYRLQNDALISFSPYKVEIPGTMLESLIFNWLSIRKFLDNETSKYNLVKYFVV